jgi:hypothetical protein
MARSGTIACANGNGPLAPISMVACIPRFLGSVAHLTCHSVFPGLDKPGLDCRRVRSGKLRPSTVDYKQGLPDCPAFIPVIKHDHYDAALVAAAGGGGDGTSATGIQEGSDAPTFGPLSF